MMIDILNDYTIIYIDLSSIYIKIIFSFHLPLLHNGLTICSINLMSIWIANVLLPTIFYLSSTKIKYVRTINVTLIDFDLHILRMVTTN